MYFENKFFKIKGGSGFSLKTERETVRGRVGSVLAETSGNYIFGFFILA